MKTRIKWIVIGVGFAFGLQVIISLVYTAIAFGAARSSAPVSQGIVSVIVLGLTLGAFLIGGFVVGWAEEHFRLLDPLAVAILTLALNAIVYQALPAGNKAQFVTGAWLADQSGAGGFWGRYTAVPTEGVVTNLALIIGLLGAVVGPFVLLARWGSDPSNPGQPGLPVTFVVTVLALLLVIVGVGFWLFSREAGREASYEKEMSISPDAHRKESQRKSA